MSKMDKIHVIVKRLEDLKIGRYSKGFFGVGALDRYWFTYNRNNDSDRIYKLLTELHNMEKEYKKKDNSLIEWSPSRRTYYIPTRPPEMFRDVKYKMQYLDNEILNSMNDKIDQYVGHRFNKKHIVNIKNLAELNKY
jgi:hypothetical protein